MAAGPGATLVTGTTDTQQPAVTVNTGNANISETGGGDPHNNLQPYIGINFIIRYQ
jgi:microcystin-dependent protein